MTVTTTTNYNESAGGGTVYYFTFPVAAAGWVKVYVGGVLQVAGYELVLNEDQSVDPGGTVTFTGATTGTVRIQRETPVTQETDYEAYRAFSAAGHEAALDKLTMEVQDEAATRTAGDVASAALVTAEAAARLAADQAEAAARAAADLQIVKSGVQVALADDAFVTASGSTTPRTLATRFSDIRNVKDFGAVGDGLTDDYAAIQAALNALPVIGGYRTGTVFFPAGTYAVAQAPAVANGKGINLVGEGPDQTVIVATAGNAAFQTYGFWRSRVQGIGFKTTAARATGAVFELDGDTRYTMGVQGNHFDNCTFDAAGLAQYAFSIVRTGAGYGQGSENLFSDCWWFGGIDACLSTHGFNALNNTIVGGNFQNYAKSGVSKIAGQFHFFSVGFQSTYIDQITNGGADIDDSYSSAGDRTIVMGCRTESPVFYKGGSAVAHIEACYQYLGCGYGNRADSTYVALDTLFPATSSTGANRVYKCTTAGVTGGSAPTWPDSGTVTDGAAVWTQLDFDVVSGVGITENCRFPHGCVSGRMHFRQTEFLRPNVLKASDSSYASGGGPSFENCWWMNVNVPPYYLPLGPFGNNSQTGARYTATIANDLRDRAIVFRDGTGGGTYYDVGIYRKRGDLPWRINNALGFVNGITLDTLTQADLADSQGDNGSLWYASDAKPGSRALSGGTGAIVAKQGGAWVALGAPAIGTATATEIADKTHAVNTTDKFPGRQVWDTTNNRVMVASGTTDTSTWYVADGSANVTPA